MTEDFDQTLRRPSLSGRESFQRTNGAEVLIVNWQNATPPEVRVSMGVVQTLLAKRRAKSLVLFDVAGLRWDAKLPFEAIPWIKDLAPLTARVAIIGIAGLQQSVLAGLRSLTRLQLPVFPDRSAATAWLTRPRSS